MLQKILLATHNPAKLKELKNGLKELGKYGYKILSLDDLNISQEPAETGNTFRKNAELKAKFYSKLTALSTIADDGGLIIPYLNNEPGVKSRRWLGYNTSDKELINYTLKRLEGTSGKQRKAYLETCICFNLASSHPAGGQAQKLQIFFEQEKILGHIADKPFSHYLRGFPYRALFIVDKFNKYYDEMTQDEHRDVNHRLKALKRLIRRIKPLIIE